MSTVAASDLFNPQVLARLVSSGFAEVPVLFGSGAVVVDTAMPYGNDYLGAKVVIPYFSVPNTWTVLADAAALTPVAVSVGNAAGNSTTPEEETVLRAGIALDMTTWAKSNPLDPYGEARKQMLAGWAQAMESHLVTKASDNTAGAWAAYINDVSAAVDPTLTHEAVVDGAALLGSEGFRDRFVLGMVHSATLASMYKRKDATGRPWLVENVAERMPDGSQIYRLAPFGTPLFVSDRLAPTVGGVYTSVFCRAGSLALWVNPNLSARSVESPTTDSAIDALNCYFTAHRYKRLPNKSKPGIVLVKHKV